MLRGARHELGHGRAGEEDQQPDAKELEPRGQRTRPRKQAKHHEAESEIVGLGEGVQAAQRVREAQQSNRAGQKEEGAGADQENSTMSKSALIWCPSYPLLLCVWSASSRSRWSRS